LKGLIKNSHGNSGAKNKEIFSRIDQLSPETFNCNAAIFGEGDEKHLV
jgi:hypothetical protein